MGNNTSTLKILPFSLYESHESKGSISLKRLFDGEITKDDDFISNLELEDLVYASCRGGYPKAVKEKDKQKALAISKEMYHLIYENDIFTFDDRKRKSSTMKAVLVSYGRHICTLAKKVSIIEDINDSSSITPNTFDDYIDVLERLNVINDLYGFVPRIRRKTAIRSGRKREFTDPSIAVNALNTFSDDLLVDMGSFSHIFETLCIRDLRSYSSKMGGKLKYYQDRNGLKADAVLILKDGRYSLINFELGINTIEEGAEKLNKIEELIKIQGIENQEPPTFKVVITASQYGGIREDGVYVVPIGCLKD